MIFLIYPSEKQTRLDTQGPNIFLIHLLFYFQLKYLTSCDFRLNHFIANATDHINSSCCNAV